MREHCRRCSTLTSQPRLCAPQGERKHVFIPLQARLDAKFYLKPKQSQIAIERRSHTFPTGYPEVLKLPQPVINIYKSPKRGGNAMGDLSTFRYSTGMAQLSSDG